MLGFDHTDSAILVTLGKGEFNMRQLAIKTGLNHQTIAYRLRRLCDLSLVEEKPAKGNQKLWGLSASRKHTKKNIETYYGNDIVRAYTIFHQIPRNSVVYTTEGYLFTELTNKRFIYEKVGIKAQGIYKKRQVILKCISAPQTPKDFVAHISPSGEFMQSLRKRSLVTTMLDSAPSLMGPCAYAIMPHAVFIANEEKRFAIVIKDKAVVTLMHEMARVFYNLLEYSRDAELVVVNDVVEKAIQKKQKKEKAS